jgi:hypothetical protein
VWCRPCNVISKFGSVQLRGDMGQEAVALHHGCADISVTVCSVGERLTGEQRSAPIKRDLRQKARPRTCAHAAGTGVLHRQLGVLS